MHQYFLKKSLDKHSRKNTTDSLSLGISSDDIDLPKLSSNSSSDIVNDDIDPNEERDDADSVYQ